MSSGLRTSTLDGEDPVMAVVPSSAYRLNRAGTAHQRGCSDTMPYLLVRHRVADYERWKVAFDAHGVTRQANGSRGGQLFRDAADPNELVVLLEWDILENARQFAHSEELREVMQRAGVVDRPDISFLKDGEQVSR
jgi:heme-degrading monooxygenase HmoA